MKKKQPLNEEFKRMQKLAGLITENQVNEAINQQVYINSNGVKFRPITQDEFDSLNEFGLIGIFSDQQHPESNVIAEVIYDKLEDFSTEEEAKRVFDNLFTDPKSFLELIYDDLYYYYKRISNKGRFELKKLIPVTYL